MSELTKEQREALEWAILPPAEWDSVPEHMNNVHRATIRAMLSTTASVPLYTKLEGEHEGCNYLYDKNGFCNKCGFMAHAPACKTCEACDMEWHTGKAVTEGHTCPDCNGTKGENK